MIEDVAIDVDFYQNVITQFVECQSQRTLYRLKGYVFVQRNYSYFYYFIEEILEQLVVLYFILNKYLKLAASTEIC